MKEDIIEEILSKEKPNQKNDLVFLMKKIDIKNKFKKIKKLGGIKTMENKYHLTLEQSVFLAKKKNCIDGIEFAN